MSRLKFLPTLLALAVLTARVPAALAGDTGAAGGERATAAEIAAYAERDAASADLAEFTGGWHGAVVFVAVVLAVFFFVVWLDHQYYYHPPPPPPPPPPWRP